MRPITLLRSVSALALVLAVAPPETLSVSVPAPPPPNGAIQAANGAPFASVPLSAPAHIVMAQYAKPQIAQYVQPIAPTSESADGVIPVNKMPIAPLAPSAPPVHLAASRPQPLLPPVSQSASGPNSAAAPGGLPNGSASGSSASLSPNYVAPDDTGSGATLHQKNVKPPHPVMGGIGLTTGNGRLITVPASVANVFVADPKIIAVRPASPNKLFIFGKSAGLTTMVATDAHGNLVAHYQVSVTPSPYPAVRIKSAARQEAPNSNVHVTTEKGGVVVSGNVNTPAEDYEIMKHAQLVAGKKGKVLNLTTVSGPQQVMVKVRIASMSRTITQQLGINWQSLGSGVAIGKFLFGFSTVGNLISSTAGATQTAGAYNLAFPSSTVPIDAVLNALNTDNLAHILAEPTLTALSGQTASFIDGGSFPVPVPGQNGQISVQYQNYGVQLSFKPVVLNNGSIALTVNPTVSSPSTQNAFQIAVAGESLVVPSLVEQSASTTVVLGSGQTFAIAGLLYNTSNQTDTSVPGLGQVPVIGGAFRADNYSRQQEELVILVTPYVVKPVNNPGELATPNDGFRNPNQLQRFLLLQNNGSTAVHATIPGQAGFMVR
jgi:pilus assembly protein CpaC